MVGSIRIPFSNVAKKKFRGFPTGSGDSALILCNIRWLEEKSEYGGCEKIFHKIPKFENRGFNFRRCGDDECRFSLG